MTLNYPLTHLFKKGRLGAIMDYKFTIESTEMLTIPTISDMMKRHSISDDAEFRTHLMQDNTFVYVLSWSDPEPELKHIPTERWKHPNGDYRSILNRHTTANNVECPICCVPVGFRCVTLRDINKHTKYPHSKREREAHRVLKEQENERT